MTGVQTCALPILSKMFDFLQIMNFNKKQVANKNIFDFESLPFYNDIKKKEYRIDLKFSKILYLERTETLDNYFTSFGKHIFIFGSVFTNNNYKTLTKTQNRKINSKAVYDLFKNYKLDLVKFIKGSFVIIIYDENENSCYLVSDRLNVLPLYYLYNNEYLIVSSSIKLIKKNNPNDNKLDNLALTEQLAFDYILDDRTLFEDIKRIKPGTIYKFNEKAISIKQYWSVEDLYTDKLLNQKESLDLLAEQLFDNVDLYTSDVDKLLVSLTGGFDGRTNLAMLKPDNFEYITFSYGMKGSRQIKVPQNISKQLNIPYKPIFCNEEFEKLYVDSANKVVEFSNGQAPFSQAV